MKCIYCDKESHKLSKEHIIPRSIGGSYEPVNPLIISNVCARCNNLAGLYIDAPFVKSWFLSNSRASMAKKHADIAQTPVLPLKYLGTLKKLKFEDKVCEFWIGPTGDSIYHFHLPYPKENNTAIDGRPSNKGIDYDRGFVFLMIRSNNPAWHPTIIRSVLAGFKGSTFYLGNGSTPRINHFCDIPSKLKQLHKEILELNAMPHDCKISFPIGFEERFLAKVALGIGSKYLKDSFKGSKDADLLRAFMNEKEFTARQKVGVKFSGMIPNSPSQNTSFFRNITTWEGGHVIQLLPAGNILSLWVSFYGEDALGIVLSENRDHWIDYISKSGFIFVLAPLLREFVGPINIFKLLEHNDDDQEKKDLEITRLESMMKANSILPPVTI